MLPKQGQKQVDKPQQQAQQTLQKRPAKPHQKSACTITNLESKTITPKPRTTSQLQPQRSGSILKKAQWILQLLQAKLSQDRVVHYFEATSQQSPPKLAENQPPLKLAFKGPTKSFSSPNSTLLLIPKLPT